MKLSSGLYSRQSFDKAPLPAQQGTFRKASMAPHVSGDDHLYGQLFDLNPLPSWVYDIHTLHFIAVNAAAVKHYGYSRDEFLGMTILDIRPAADVPDLLNYLRSRPTLNDKYPVWLHRKKNGELLEVEVTSHDLMFEDREARLVLVNDVTKKRQAERALLQSESLYRSIVETSQEGIVSFDARGKVNYCNARMAELLGYKAEEILKLTVFDLVAESNHAKLRNCLERRRQGLAETVEYELRHRDGSALQVLAASAPLYDESGNWKGILDLVTDITARKQTEVALEEAERKYRGLFENSLEGIYQSTPEGRYVTANQMLASIYGYSSPQELIDSITNMAQVYVEPGRREEFVRLLHKNGQVSRFESPIRRRDGSIIWISENARELRSEDGTLLGYEGTTVDISNLKEAEASLRLTENRLREIVEHSSNLFYTQTPEHVLTYVSPQSRQFFDCEPEEALVNWTEFVTENPLNTEGLLIRQRAIETGVQHQPYRLELRSRAGRKLWVEVNEAPVVRDGKTTAVVGALVDITRRTEYEEQLQHQAFHDMLTGLPNRALFMDRVQHALDRARYHNEQCAVLFLDLDRFKVVNDSLGHEMGDQLLQIVAERLRTCIRPSDTPARLGGDEFGVLLENIEGVHDAVFVADCIAASLRDSIQLRGQEVFITTSIGIKLSETTSSMQSKASLPDDTFSADAQLRDADVAMYRAKNKGRASYEIFDPEMNAHALELLELETDLRGAIERNELQLYYQPILDANDGGLRGLEALIRWQHPQRGLLMPADFLELATEAGLMVALGEWVLQEACIQAAKWQKLLDDTVARGGGLTPRYPLQIAVNISARQLRQPELLPLLQRVLDESGLPARQLSLEITENDVMEEAETTIGTLRQITSLGVQLAIDDFGTGYSSLSYLRRFPVHTLKIDRSFVASLGSRAEETEIVRAILSLAQALNLQTVAEGVENAEHIAQLRNLRCDLIQGFFYSQPLPATAIEAFLLSAYGSNEAV